MPLVVDAPLELGSGLAWASESDGCRLSDSRACCGMPLEAQAFRCLSCFRGFGFLHPSPQARPVEDSFPRFVLPVNMPKGESQHPIMNELPPGGFPHCLLLLQLLSPMLYHSFVPLLTPALNPRGDSTRRLSSRRLPVDDCCLHESRVIPDKFFVR